ncbi:hypothetical protein N431DRAFT_457696 [Stipitochalara longipes BDJ]|nr:hypothetical protein N431DRAFT_457696 [Stipitochalara longipes BDJ]
MSTNSTVYTGFWKNLAKGEVVGSTLTLSNRNGAVLIAALAIFIQLAGQQSWSIICFVTHQLRVTMSPRNGFYHQQQSIFRNNRSDISTVWQLMKIGWAWRARSVKSTRKSLKLILLAITHFLLFAAAGILASHITTVGNQVLLSRSSSCGPWSDYDSSGLAGPYEIASGVARDSYIKTSVTASKEYIQSCLGGSSSGSGSQLTLGCNKFNSLGLNWTSTTVPCPFGNLCLGPPNISLHMDTGLLDSRADFGINSHDDKLIQWRKTATCSPITTDGYVKGGVTTIENNTVNYLAAFYGPSGYNTTHLNASDVENATYIYTNFRDFASEDWNQLAPLYDIYFAYSDLIGMDPIPALSIPNSTVTLIFASFCGYYTTPSDDLWLSAHKNLTFNMLNENGKTITSQAYGIDNFVNVVACVEQYQFCIPSPGGVPTCTPFVSQNDLYFNLSTLPQLQKIHANEYQIATAESIIRASHPSSISLLIQYMDSPLLAESLAKSTMSMPIASDQWVLESKNWFSLGLASMQHMAVDYVTGPPAEYSQYTPGPGNDTGLNWLCENQIVRSEDYINFSTLAIFLIFALGGLVIFSSLWLETAVGLIRLRSRRSRWKQTAWWAEGILQLQWQAFEGIGIGGWEVKEWDQVPLAEEGKEFTGLRSRDSLAVAQTMKTKHQSTSSTAGFEKGATVRVFSVTSSNEGIQDVRRVRSKSF